METEKRDWEKAYLLWRKKAVADEDLVRELQEMEENRQKIKDAFYRNLSFGTGGLRGIIGAGTNRMNVYTVARASEGLAAYIKKKFPEEKRRMAVSYDSRVKSGLFARTAAAVFAGNGIRVFIYPELMPTPCLSFAVRELDCAAGIMITASHNPAQYNGYKVYGKDGGQITSQAAGEIFCEMEKVNVFEEISGMHFEDGIIEGKISFIPEDICTAFIKEVKKQSVLGSSWPMESDLGIVYSPLNGTGLKPVLRILQESGFSQISIVPEQERPDGRFPTCPYPNPEIPEAMAPGIEYAKRKKADLFLATDPDCDRVGTAVRDSDGNYVHLSGNETGVLLLHYICSRLKEKNAFPEAPVFIKTIVTSELAERIASQFGVRTISVLTGFKYIGEWIGRLERENREQDFIFGFEESCGYLRGTYVRDKDAVGAVLLICEMEEYYRKKGSGLLEQLEELYKTYGYFRNTLYTFEFEGIKGVERMREIMEFLRRSISEIGGRKVEECVDYEKGVDNLPKSDVLKFILQGGASIIVRPSGTEPKIKVYLSVCRRNKREAFEEEKEIAAAVKTMLSDKI